MLEHLDDPSGLIKTLRNKPTGTIFVFSVPTFGFATILESVFHDYAARNLDSVVHRQLYTDKSICYLLKQIDYEPISQWVFGQDTDDLVRILIKNISNYYDSKIINHIKYKLNNLIDPIQNSIDRELFSDSRHIIAIKR